jgi:hypothetical protein
MYSTFLTERRQALLGSEDSREESLLQALLEQHPSLLPGPHSVDGDSSHAPAIRAILRRGSGPAR